MYRRSLIIISATLLTIACQHKKARKHNYIVFYKPYTVELENNFFSHDSLKWTMLSQHTNLLKADVGADFSRAISRRDYRLIAISGNSYILPGVTEYLQKLNKGMTEKTADSIGFWVYGEKYKYKAIAGTSDAINPIAPDVQILAADYAQKYNRMMLDYIREHNISGK